MRLNGEKWGSFEKQRPSKAVVNQPLSFLPCPLPPFTSLPLFLQVLIAKEKKKKKYCTSILAWGYALGSPERSLSSLSLSASGPTFLSSTTLYLFCWLYSSPLLSLILKPTSSPLCTRDIVFLRNSTSHNEYRLFTVHLTMSISRSYIYLSVFVYILYTFIYTWSNVKCKCQLKVIEKY